MIIYEEKVMLQRVISGGQTGADQAGLYAAQEFGYETGGWAPGGFRTLAGNNPRILRDRFGLIETAQRNYQIRTELNAKNSDATIRLASNFNTPGELCTLKAICKHKKPYFDVNMSYWLGEFDRDQYIKQRTDEFVEFLTSNQVAVLNVAGNADRPDQKHGNGFHFNEARAFLRLAFTKLKTHGTR
jgi:hypothetical protein